MSLINQVLTFINDNLLRILTDLENTYQGIVEDWSDKLNISKPRVILTITEVNECGNFPDETKFCQLITGIYIPENLIILMNYKSNLGTFLHLFIHHLQACEVGIQKFTYSRRIEELRLPWCLRPSELSALVRTKTLSKELLTHRVLNIWTHEIKPKIKILSEQIERVKNVVQSILRASQLIM